MVFKNIFSGKKKFRIERDILGKVKVPKDVFYGIQTVRASNNFDISDIKIPFELNDAIVQVKMAAAKTNMEVNLLNNLIGNAIVNASSEILKGKYDDQFILDVYQAGAGTPWHMNVNEVIANVALKSIGYKKGNYNKIDPHDHVNMGQSSNDVIPTAIRIASIILTNELSDEIKNLNKTMRNKGREFKNLSKAGRTHLQDAVPITLGEDFNAWASDLEHRSKDIDYAKQNLFELSIGGTAVGTGINTHRRFPKLIVKHLRKQTRLPLKNAKDKIEKIQFMGDFLELSSELRNFAVDLIKICNDLRLLNSGPRTGLNEIRLPQVEPGSSIMPSKFNPSIVEMLNMVCFQVIGNDETIKEAAESGQLELNVFTPVIAYNLIQSLKILKNGINTFNNKCIKGIKANKKVLQYYLEMSPSLGTVLNPIIGYDETAKVIKEALKRNKTVKQIVIEKGLLNKKEAHKIFKKIWSNQ